MPTYSISEKLHSNGNVYEVLLFFGARHRFAVNSRNVCISPPCCELKLYASRESLEDRVFCVIIIQQIFVLAIHSMEGKCFVGGFPASLPFPHVDGQA